MVLKKFFRKVIKNPVVSTVLGFVLFILFAATLMFLIESNAANHGFDSFFHSLWFSIVTITTVGYGDISPVSPLGQLLAIFIIFVGIGYSGVLTGSITSWLVERNRRKLMGLVPLKNVEGKFLVCGWKSDMQALLKDILKLWGGDSSQLILLNKVASAEVQSLRKDPQLEHFLYYSGDDTNLEDLTKAGATQIHRVLILADQQPDKSTEEIDFQSILTSLALHRLNPTAYQVVELLLPKFRQYLSRAKVEEVLLNRASGRTLLCNIALMSGMYNVFKALFSLDEGALEVRDLGPEVWGSRYGELRSGVQDAVVIGLLENQGNLNQRKVDKMNEVQRSASIKDAIEGLLELKTMKSNEPLFNPPPDYVIRENSGLILLKRPPGELNLLNSQGPGAQGDIDHSRLIAATLHELLAQTDTWEDYFNQLEQQGMTLYLQEGFARGVSHLERNYRFEKLDLSAQFAELLIFWHDRARGECHLGLEPLISGWKTPREFVSRHPLEMPRYRPEGTRTGQLMVLGWKNEVIEMLHYLVAHQFEDYVRWEGITLVAEVGEAERAQFEEHFGSREGVRLVVGDVANREVLIQAGIAQTKKMMVLAETGRGKSFEEIDAQTVLACMLAGDLNRKTYIAAELLNRKYQETLEGANVEEVFLFDQFSNIMLANGSHGKGVSNVIRDMVDLGSKVLEIHLIDPRFIESSFSELVRHYQRPGTMVVGLLEEAGNLYARKSERIHQAQRQPKIQASVEELMLVKQISANKVLLSPPMAHRIKPHSRMILIQSSKLELWNRQADQESA
ncbi:MAG: ion channel [bacterium]|nr:ion channel [bacterium]